MQVVPVGPLPWDGMDRPGVGETPPHILLLPHPTALLPVGCSSFRHQGAQPGPPNSPPEAAEGAQKPSDPTSTLPPLS